MSRLDVGAEGSAGVDGGTEGTTPARPRRRSVTRQLVLDAAREVFAERGVFGATVEDICAHAGFTRGAFYSSFGDKGELLRALLDQEHEALLRHLDAGFEQLDVRGIQAAGPGADLGRVAVIEIERLLRSVPVDRGFFLIQAELELHALRDPALVGEFRDAQARFRQRIATFLLVGLGRVGRELIVDLDDATEAILAIVERSTRRALLAGGEADATALSRTLLPLLLAAVTRPVATADEAAPAGT